MAEFRIAVTISHRLPPSVLRATFPTLAAAVREITEEGQRRWVDYAMGKPLPNGRQVKNATGAYARSIQVRQIDDLTGEVFSELPYANAIETGTRARDLHEMLAYSLKVRTSRAGRRYLIIPFRHYHSRSVIGRPMPAAIETWWRNRSPAASSHVHSIGWRPSGTGAIAFRTVTGARFRLVRGQVVHVRARSYQWNARLTARQIRALGLGEEHVRRYAGMVRFDKPPRAQNKGGGHQQFITFRTLAEGSPGWRVPARPGLHIAQTVAEQLRPIAEKAFPLALEADIRAMLGDVTAPPS